MGEKITYGIRNGHYAPATYDSEGTPIFGTVKRWEGWSEMSLPPVGDPVNVFADDVVYFKSRVNQGYEGTVSVYSVPEDFKINHLGEYRDANGVLIERSSVQPKDFALLGEFQTEGEESANPKRFALYNCSAGRADLTGVTKTGTIEPTTFSIPITAAPTIKDEIVKATILKNANEALFNTWFSTVYYNPDLVVMQRLAITVTAGANPIAGATVVVGDKIAKTNASGIALFSMGAGTFDLFVSAEGFAATVDSVTVDSAAVNKSVALTGA